MEIINLKAFAGAIIYSGLGITILFIAFWFFEKITPENLRKEIFINKNNAFAIVAASFVIAIAIIVASAIH